MSYGLSDDLDSLFQENQKLEKRIEGLEAEKRDYGLVRDKFDEQVRENRELQSRIEAGLKQLNSHCDDLEKTADIIEEWQDPMVGTFDAMIRELRKASKELREALNGKPEPCQHVFRNVTGKPWRKCMECGVVIDDS